MNRYILILLIVAGCNKSEKPLPCADCGREPLAGFIETYRNYFEDGYSHYSNYGDYYSDGGYRYFFVKGLVTAIDGARIEAKVLEDIGKNYDGGSLITLWGNPWKSTWNYTLNDTLLIMMTRIERVTFSCYHEVKRGHYEEIPCTYSILSLSEGYATGIINTDNKIISVPWYELQTLLFSDNHCRSKLNFIENYHTNINNEDVFYIKGTKTEIFSTGIKIKLIEDLKGNFSGDSTFVVWGGGDASLCVDPLIELLNYEYQAETFVMLIKLVVADVPFSNRMKGDFSTIDCAYSVVPINELGNIVGDRRHVITPELYALPEYRWGSLTWEDFQELLNTTN